MKKVAVILKTFLRDEYLRVCVESLQRYDFIKIYIADDGYQNDQKQKLYEQLRKEGHEVYLMPFDCGITYGRNFLIEQVKEPYVLIGDDDFLYDDNTNIEAFIKVLDLDHSIDIIGGRIKEKGEIKDYQGYITNKDGEIRITRLPLDQYTELKGIKYKRCDLIYNFFLARTKIFKKIQWDNTIKVCYEHEDFFLDAQKKEIKIAFTPDVVVIHKPESVIFMNNYEYVKYRFRQTDKEYFCKKWNIKNFIDMNNNKL